MVYQCNERLECSPINPVFDDFKQFALAEIAANETYSRKKLSEFAGRMVRSHEISAFREALNLLKQGEFLRFCVEIVNDYHALDSEVAALLMRSALRVSFKSTSALLHYSATGSSGGGKNDLIKQIVALLPESRLKVFNSITPQVLYYSTLKELKTPKGQIERVTDPTAYDGKLLIVTEIADSKQFTALKAFAEMEEETAFTHSTTIGGKAASLTVQGARGVWVTSVKGLNDTEANRRFINLEIADQSEKNRLARCEVASSNLVTERKIETDKRTPIAKAGFEILLNGVMPYAFEVRDEYADLREELVYDAATLFRALAKALTLDGVNVTEIKQLYSLAQCGSAEKQFKRGYQGLTVSDVCEAWYLLRPWISAQFNEIEINSVVYKPKDPLR